MIQTCKIPWGTPYTWATTWGASSNFKSLYHYVIRKCVSKSWAFSDASQSLFRAFYFIKSWTLNSKWVSALGHTCSSQYKRSVSKASQRTFEHRRAFCLKWWQNIFWNAKKMACWTDNWDDSLKINIWPQLSGQFSDHRSQIFSVQTTNL
jgi:hypothetical protein